MSIYTLHKPTKVNRTLEFPEAVGHAFKNIFNFKGRARRSEYWWTMLALYLITIIVYIVAMFPMLFSMSTMVEPRDLMGGSLASIGIIGLWIVIEVLVSLSLTVRRLHDTGHSGWLLGAVFIAGVAGLIIVGILSASNLPYLSIMFSFLFAAAYVVLGIYVFILTLIDSNVTENRYGPSQKYEVEEPTAPAEDGEEPTVVPEEEIPDVN